MNTAGRSIRLLFVLTAIFVSVASASTAMAEVYLNGVKVAGLRNQQFKGAEVRFDEMGNVFINVKGIDVQVAGSPTPVTPEPAVAQTRTPKKSYFLVSDKSNRGATQYNIDVHINGAFITRVKSEDGLLALDITKHLVPGNNRVVFTAIKKLDTPRKSFSPADTFTLMVGEGTKAGNQIMVQRSLMEYKRTAADVANDSIEKMIVIE
jgi:hypothetical protein